MKKIKLNKYLFFLILIHPVLSIAQDDDLIPFNTTSRPSMASYQNTPVDYCTGIPDMSYDLLNLETASNNLGFNLSLSFHPNNLSVQQRISEVGKGWSLLGIPSISKDSSGNPDEEVPLTGPNPYGKKVDDIYYYNINGENGRFTIEHDTLTFSFSLRFLDKTQLKVAFDYTTYSDFGFRNFRINSFTVTDTNGLVYYFGLFNKDRGDVRATFFLTKVIDANNEVLCALNYHEVYQNIGKNQTVNALDEIIATNVGKLKFNFTIQTNFIDKNIEIMKLEDISLFTANDALLKKCLFNYEGNRTLNSLHKLDANNNAIEKYKFLYEPIFYPNDPTDYVNGDGQYFEWGQSGYDYFGFKKTIKKCSARERIIKTPYQYANKQSVRGGVLKSVILPTGGRIDYDFESNTVDPEGYEVLPDFHPDNDGFLLYDDFVEGNFIGHTFEDFTLKPFNPLLEEVYLSRNEDNFYIENLGSRTFTIDPSNLSFPFPFTLSQETELYIRFSGLGNPSPYIEDPEAQNLTIGYEVLDANSVVKGSFAVSKNEATNCFNLADKIILPAGTYRIKIIAPFGGYVDYTLFAKRKSAQKKFFYYAGGVRIKSIKHYENENSTIPLKSLSFSYNDFNTPSRSSGTLYTTTPGKMIPDVGNITGCFVLYKNVKVSENNNGYTKYFFYTPTDGLNIDVYDTHFYYGNVLKKGLLHSKKVFDNSNTLLATERNYYILSLSSQYEYDTMYDNINGIFITDVPPLIINGTKVKNCFIERVYSKKVNHFSNGSVTSKSVTQYNSWNHKPTFRTDFDSQDKKMKTLFYYLNDRPNTPFATELMAKNIVSDVIETENYYDGELISKSKVEFDSFENNVYKKSKTYTAKGAGNYSLEKRISAVDNISNKIREVTNDRGSFTSYIWGYNKTLPVAKIENIAYASIPTSLITAIQGASSESSLQTALTALRTNVILANALVTTYTYKPLIGISTTTDSKGYMTQYFYDTFGRLTLVKDHDGKILTTNNYNYRP